MCILLLDSHEFLQVLRTKLYTCGNCLHRVTAVLLIDNELCTQTYTSIGCMCMATGKIVTSLVFHFMAVFMVWVVSIDQYVRQEDIVSAICICICHQIRLLFASVRYDSAGVRLLFGLHFASSNWIGEVDKDGTRTSIQTIQKLRFLFSVFDLCY